jgi:hypothetical protein
MMSSIAQVGEYMIPSGVFTLWNHLEPTAKVGSNCQIWLVEATLISKPPKMYSLLSTVANPPGRMVPDASPGQLSEAPSVSIVSLTGL